MNRWSRRDCLKFAGSAAVAAWAGSGTAQAQASPSLDELARAGGRRFGSAIGTQTLVDPKYCVLVQRECGLLVAQDELKWYVIRAKPEGFDFHRADRLIDFAKQNRLGFRGHTLLWHHPSYLPQWLESYDFGSRPAVEAERMVVEYIDKVTGRYGDIIQSWDVVNETVDQKTGELRETALSRRLGRQEVVEIAFHAARRAAPKGQLVYNDYMSWERGGEAHRTGVLKLLESLLAKKVPVDALGVQSHIHPENADAATGYGRPQEREWRAFLDEVTGMGLDLLITEFDVLDRDLPADIAVRDAAAAAYGRAYLDLMLSYPQLDTVMAWGMVDHHSWLQKRAPRSDGLPKRPTPYDKDYSAKPLREAIAAAFRAAPKRTSSGGDAIRRCPATARKQNKGPESESGAGDG